MLRRAGERGLDMPDRRESRLSQLWWDEMDDAVKSNAGHDMDEETRRCQRDVNTL